MGAAGSIQGDDNIGPEDGADVAGDNPEAHAKALAEVERLRALIRANAGGASESDFCSLFGVLQEVLNGSGESQRFVGRN